MKRFRVNTESVIAVFISIKIPTARLSKSVVRLLSKLIPLNNQIPPRRYLWRNFLSKALSCTASAHFSNYNLRNIFRLYIRYNINHPAASVDNARKNVCHAPKYIVNSLPNKLFNILSKGMIFIAR
jgi:hypothetical protein